MTTNTQPAIPTRNIPRPLGGRSISKVLWKRLHLPRGLVHSGLSAAKRALSPDQVRERADLAKEIAANSRAIGTITDDAGHLLFGPGTSLGALPGTEAALARCRELFEECRSQTTSADLQFNPNKNFLLAVRSGSEFADEPDLIRYMVSREILDTVTAYLGTVPLLAGAALWWSPVNDTATASQLYHFDNEDWRQVKVLINVADTDQDHGPFTLLPAGLSDRLRADLAYRTGRVADEALMKAGAAGQEVALTGPAGSGAFVDTSRCFHFGSRGNTRDRLVLMIQFMRFDSPTESTFDLTLPPDILGADADAVQRLALAVC